MTETTLAVLMNRPGFEIVPGSVGVILPNTEAKVCFIITVRGSNNP